jgi:RNA polymerase sigma-70 factor (ECF subfamily)
MDYAADRLAIRSELPDQGLEGSRAAMRWSAGDRGADGGLAARRRSGVDGAARMAFHGGMPATEPATSTDGYASGMPADFGALILAIAAERDRRAFAALFRHFAPRLKAYLMRLGAEAGQAEELAQESMIMVWRRAETFDPTQASAATWIFRIARNKRIDALRRERRPELDPEDPCLQPESAPAADRQVERRQTDERIRAALALLPEEQAEVVRMAYFDDMAHGAIAERTELPLGTVKSRMRLAMGRLRKALREEESDEG